VDLLAETLPTLLGQTFEDFELVIVDNASTDGTEDFVRSVRDPRIRYVRNPENVGLIANQNRCMEEARGEYIAVYHDHDLYDPDLARQSVEILDNHPNVGIVCAGIDLVDPFDPSRLVRRHVEKWDRIMPGMAMHKILLHHYMSPITAPTTMARRICYEQCGVMRMDVGEGADRDLWLRIFRHWDMGYIPGPMAKLRDRVKHSEFSFAQAKHWWHSLEGEAHIQKIHLEDTFKNSPVQLRWERFRAKATQYREFWRCGLWAVGRGHAEVAAVGVDAFRSMGMPFSARVLNQLRQSRLAQSSFSQALRMYRLIHG
jgi:glycosyltransferase involved in cell wall biosynthesis